MASDNDWYSDESDETHYREEESRMWNEMGELNNDIIATWDYIKKQIIEVKAMEKKYMEMDESWQEYCEVCSND